MEHQLQQYTCPMHPQVMQDKPGTCPICGMTLVLAEKAGDKDVDSHNQHGSNTPMGHTGHNHGGMIAKSDAYNLLLAELIFFTRPNRL